MDSIFSFCIHFHNDITLQLKKRHQHGPFCWMSQKRGNIFPENKNARFGHLRINNSRIWREIANFGAKSRFFLLGDFCPILYLDIARAYMVSCACVPKSSANYLVRVEFSQKCFVDLIFGHRFLSIFSKFFRVLCKVISKYNKIN